MIIKQQQGLLFGEPRSPTARVTHRIDDGFCIVANNLYFCRKLWTMAKPIKETPVLYDEDAYRFEMAAINVKPLSDASKNRINEAYERLKKVADFAL